MGWQGLEKRPRPGNSLSPATLFVAVFFRMGFGGFYRMLRGLFMMPTRGMRMMRGFLVTARLMVFGGFLMMPRGVLMLFSRFLVMLCSFGGHGKPPWKVCFRKRDVYYPLSLAVRPLGFREDHR
jgi:hypothetical protein